MAISALRSLPARHFTQPTAMPVTNPPRRPRPVLRNRTDRLCRSPCSTDVSPAPQSQTASSPRAPVSLLRLSAPALFSHLVGTTGPAFNGSVGPAIIMAWAVKVLVDSRFEVAVLSSHATGRHRTWIRPLRAACCNVAGRLEPSLPPNKGI